MEGLATLLFNGGNMPIKYTPEFNQEIRRIVRNFNDKRNRAIRRGYTEVPEKVYVSELKKRYQSRTLLQKELNLLKKFNEERDTSLEVLETLAGGKIIRWEYDYLLANLKEAKQFYDREIEEARQADTGFNVIQREYLNNMQAKRKFLDLEIMNLNQSEIRTYQRTIDEYLSSSKRDLDAYRGWLKEVEIIMRQLGYDNKTINQFFDGFSELNARQFTKMYREHALVSRIYELYIPTKDASFKLSTDEDDARSLIETFMQEKEMMIEKAKKY